MNTDGILEVFRGNLFQMRFLYDAITISLVLLRVLVRMRIDKKLLHFE